MEDEAAVLVTEAEIAIKKGDTGVDAIRSSAFYLEAIAKLLAAKEIRNA